MGIRAIPARPGTVQTGGGLARFGSWAVTVAPLSSGVDQVQAGRFPHVVGGGKDARPQM
jgi:hypothetical protein